jgi:copper(I)-binding protein
MLNLLKSGGIFAALLFLMATFPNAHDHKVGGLVIDHPWIRATPAGAKTAGGYVKITNHGTETERLIGGSATGTETFEIHEMAMSENVMKMRKLDAPLEIKPGETLELKSGGFHLMLIGLAAGYKEGETIKGTLVFEKAGTVEIEFKVEPTAGKSDHSGHGDGHKAH